FHPKLGRYAKRTLAELGIDVRTGTLVEKADEASVQLSNGAAIETRTIVWSAGVRPSDPLDDAAQRSRSRRLDVDRQLRLRDHPDVYVIGDAASVRAGEGELPMLS